MEDTMFIHRKCGGSLVVDVTSSFRLVSPSMYIGNGNLVVGVTELREASGKTFPGFICTKCEEEITDPQKDIMARCMICGENHPLEKMKGSRQLSSVCDTCVSYITGEKETPDKMRKTLQYLNLRGSDVKFFKLADILKKSVTFS